MPFKNSVLVILLGLILLSSCNSAKTEQESQTTDSLISIRDFGTFDNEPVKLYTLKNNNGMEVSVMNYGGIIVSLKVPDKAGVMEDVVLGYDSLNQYMTNNPYFGALIGRYGNRIEKGKFNLNGTAYSLPVNDGENHLHGGTQGFDKVYWNIQPDSNALILTYTSKDGEQGYPGNLSTEVRYTLTDDNELKIDYLATTDKPTIVNLTQHSYFNLSGRNSEILNHTLQINADTYLPVDKGLIPTGILAPVEKTPFDFRNAERIGARINDDHEQLKLGRGYDHCWVLNNKDKNKSLSKVATLTDSVSGRQMEVFTTEPGLQFYAGNFLDGTIKGKKGEVYTFRSGLCLETQHYPDSPNKNEFPSVTLNPGEKYVSTTVYKFMVTGK
jgi:aldose 1-epimerase